MDQLKRLQRFQREAQQTMRVVEKTVKMAEQGYKAIEKRVNARKPQQEQPSQASTASFKTEEQNFQQQQQQAQFATEKLAANTCVNQPADVPFATVMGVAVSDDSNSNGYCDTNNVPVVQGTVINHQNLDSSHATTPVNSGGVVVQGTAVDIEVFSPKHLLNTCTPLPDDLQPPPPPTDPSKYDANYCKVWLQKISNVFEIPNLQVVDKNNFQTSLEYVQEARNNKNNATALRNKIEHTKPVNQAELKAANEAVQIADQALQKAMDAVLPMAQVLFQNDQALVHFLSTDYDDTALILYAVLKQMTPNSFQKWCAKGQEQREALFRLLTNNVDLMRVFLIHGGAKNGQYGQAMINFENLTKFRTSKYGKDNDPVLDRLLLAVSLELAEDVFRCINKAPIEPVDRYDHYAQAYTKGELDPAFGSFSVWELRMAIDCDATHEELAWGRQSLKNYRPDLVLSNDQQWRYCQIVKSDVAYKVPDWYKEPHSYDQILAGGGKCGPRAWYGRFSCKAFGIPVWGCRQPGHAAMVRWTPTGWIACLGAGLPHCNWDGRTGPEFNLEAQARSMLPTSEDYYRKVVRLECMACIMDEKGQQIRNEMLVDPKSPWWSLQLLQRKILVSKFTQYRQKHTPPNRFNVWNDMNARKLDDVCEKIEVKRPGECIVIPASSWAGKRQNNKKVSAMKSFLGGSQVLLSGDAVVDYELTSDVLPAKTQQYAFSIRLNTVHRNEQPLLLTVSSNRSNDPVGVFQIPLPYTMGLWEQTEPVTIEIPGGCQSVKLSVTRQGKQFCISVKDLTLTPI